MQSYNLYETHSRQQFIQDPEKEREARSKLMREQSQLAVMSARFDPDLMGGYTAEGKVQLSTIEQRNLVLYKKEINKNGTAGEKAEWAKDNMDTICTQCHQRDVLCVSSDTVPCCMPCKNIGKACDRVAWFQRWRGQNALMLPKLMLARLLQFLEEERESEQESREGQRETQEEQIQVNVNQERLLMKRFGKCFMRPNVPSAELLPLLARKYRREEPEVNKEKLNLGVDNEINHPTCPQLLSAHESVLTAGLHETIAPTPTSMDKEEDGYLQVGCQETVAGTTMTTEEVSDIDADPGFINSSCDTEIMVPTTTVGERREDGCLQVGYQEASAGMIKAIECVADVHPDSGLVDPMSFHMEVGVSLDDEPISTGSNGAFRTLNEDPDLTVSAFVYTRYGVKDSAALSKCLTNVCERRNSRIALRSIHRDPLPLRDSPYPGFVVEFGSAVQSVSMGKLLAETHPDDHLWVFISGNRAARLALVATDYWLVPHDPASYLLPSVVSSPSTSGPSHGGSSLHNRLRARIRSAPYPAQTTTGRSQYGTTPPDGSPTSINPALDPSGHPLRRIRRHKRGAKNPRAGCREALTKKFNLHFWDIVDTITDRELASCSIEQQQYIAAKKAQRDSGSTDREGGRLAIGDRTTQQVQLPVF